MKFIVMCAMVISLLMPAISHAQIPSWQMIPEESSISFTATQNNSPVTGKFKEFTAVIKGSPQQLDSSQVYIKINMNSVHTDYSLVADTLKTADWFDVKQYPEGIFEAKHFRQTANNAYQADGMLTLRDKTLPVSVNFVIENIAANKIQVKGAAVFKRIAFGVGQGDFSKTDEVKNDVRVDFVLAAVKK